MGGYVYILISLKDNNQYVGSAKNVDKRLKQHNAGLVKSTKNRRPLKIKYVIEYKTINEAVRMEKLFKKSHNVLSRELKKRNLI